MLGTKPFFFKGRRAVTNTERPLGASLTAMSDDEADLQVLTTAADEMQQTLIVGRLTEAGIRSMRTGGAVKRGIAGSWNVYVFAADLERARALLKEDEGGFDEDELARLSEEAGKEHPTEP